MLIAELRSLHTGSSSMRKGAKFSSYCMRLKIISLDVRYNWSVKTNAINHSYPVIYRVERLTGSRLYTSRNYKVGYFEERTSNLFLYALLSQCYMLLLLSVLKLFKELKDYSILKVGNYQIISKVDRALEEWVKI